MKELLHFTASWCQPCKAMAPIIDKFIADNPDIIYTKIDVDSDINFVQEFEIRSVPTLIVRVDGKVTNRHTGIANAIKLKELLD